MTFLPTEPLAVWVAALRSGEFEQGAKALHPDDAYCCLGVMCEIAPDVAWTSDYHPDRVAANFVVMDSNGKPPEAVMREFGLDSYAGEPDLLVEFNDGGDYDFEDIANWIEAHTVEIDGKLWVVQGEDD